MKSLITRFAKDQSGATAIEYGLLAGFISIAIIVSLPTISTELKRVFGLVQTELQNAK